MAKVRHGCIRHTSETLYDLSNVVELPILAEIFQSDLLGVTQPAGVFAPAGVLGKTTRVHGLYAPTDRPEGGRRRPSTINN